LERVCRDPDQSILLFGGANGQHNFAQIQQRWASECTVAHDSACWILTRRPFDQCGGFESGDSSTADGVNERLFLFFFVFTLAQRAVPSGFDDWKVKVANKNVGLSTEVRAAYKQRAKAPAKMGRTKHTQGRKKKKRGTDKLRSHGLQGK
jgi:hypothetical protein